MGFFGSTRRKRSQVANLNKQKRRLMKKVAIKKLKAEVANLKKQVGEF